MRSAERADGEHHKREQQQCPQDDVEVFVDDANEYSEPFEHPIRNYSSSDSEGFERGRSGATSELGG